MYSKAHFSCIYSYQVVFCNAPQKEYFMKVSTLVGMMVSAGTARHIIQFVTLLVVSAGISTAPVQQAWAADCSDPDETPFESLTLPGTIVTVPAQTNRSLCGFYDSDYIAFMGGTGKTYHIEILNFEAPNDLQLAVYSHNATGNYTSITSVAGTTELDLPVNVSGKYIVSVTSGRSLLGFYGGGDYVFKLTAVSEAPPEPTPALSSTQLEPNKRPRR